MAGAVKILGQTYSFKYLPFTFGKIKAQRPGHFEPMSGGTSASWPMASSTHYHKRTATAGEFPGRATFRCTIRGPCEVRHVGQGIPFLWIVLW